MHMFNSLFVEIADKGYKRIEVYLFRSDHPKKLFGALLLEHGLRMVELLRCA